MTLFRILLAALSILILGGCPETPTPTEDPDIEDPDGDDDDSTGDDDDSAPVSWANVLVKGVSFTTVYMVNADETCRFTFPNEDVFLSWDLDFQDVVEVEDDFLEMFPLCGNIIMSPGSLIKITSSPNVWAIDFDGAARWIQTEADAVRLFGEDWDDQVVDVPDAFFADYAFGADIDETVTEFDPEWPDYPYEI